MTQSKMVAVDWSDVGTEALFGNSATWWAIQKDCSLRTVMNERARRKLTEVPHIWSLFARAAWLRPLWLAVTWNMPMKPRQMPHNRRRRAEPWRTRQIPLNA